MGFQTTALIDNRINLAGWFGWTNAVDATNGDRATILNWALTFTWLDAFAEGNKAGLIVGMPPKLTSIDSSSPDPDMAVQIEAFYSHRLNQNIFINPGFYAIFNPENDSRNDTIFVGLFRTTYQF